MTGGAGSIGIKADSGSTNIATGSIANVVNVKFQGVTTALSGVTITDIRWNFKDNGTLADSIADAMISLDSNGTTTVLAVGVPTLVLGTWTPERASMFTTTTDGRCTYLGERDLVVPIDAVMTLDPDSGTAKVIRAYIAVNGVEIVNSGKAIQIDSGDPLEVTLIWQLNLSENDYVELFIENETDSVDVTVNDAVLRIR